MVIHEWLDKVLVDMKAKHKTESSTTSSTKYISRSSYPAFTGSREEREKANYDGLETLQKLRKVVGENFETERKELIRTRLNKAQAAMIKAEQEKPSTSPAEVPRSSQRKNREDNPPYNMSDPWRSYKPKYQEHSGELREITFDLSDFLNTLHSKVAGIDRPLKIYLKAAKRTRNSEEDRQTRNRRLDIIKTEYMLHADIHIRYYYATLGRRWTIEQSASNYIGKLEYNEPNNPVFSGYNGLKDDLEGQARRGSMLKFFHECLTEIFVKLERLEGLEELEPRLSEREH